VRYALWAPRYEAIRADFGFPFDAEERSAAALARLLPADARTSAAERLARRLRGRDAIVVGLAPDAGPPPIWRLGAGGPAPSIIAADGAARTCLEAGLVPAVIATDLDGPVPSEIEANGRGSLVVVHAHGDNPNALERWVPEFPGELAGSWAGAPRDGLVNPGGFTDGDRAAYLADDAGAERILLWGFDFGAVAEAEPRARETKARKLAWAARLLAELAEARPAPTLLWRRDGSFAQVCDRARSTR
jgi:2-amino-4-hydroxy-6-hydroxymethyldihydropteridine diphosphokinase